MAPRGSSWLGSAKSRVRAFGACQDEAEVRFFRSLLGISRKVRNAADARPYTRCPFHLEGRLTRCPVLDPKTERLTIQRARGGDREAIALLIRSYQKPLEAFLFRLCGKVELAEDISQEAFVRVIKSLDRFDERFRFSTWLFTIGKRLLVNHCQKMKPRADSEAVEFRADHAQTPLMEIQGRERQERMQDMISVGLGALVSPQREIVLLFHQQGWPVERIAAELRMPEGTVKSHLFRARKRMLEAIELRCAPKSDRSATEELLEILDWEGAQ